MALDHIWHILWNGSPLDLVYECFRVDCLLASGESATLYFLMTFCTSRPPPGWFQCGLCLSELFLMMKETIQTERYESLEKVEPVTYLEWHLTVHIILLRSNDNIFFFFLFFRVNFPPHLPSPSWQLSINENIYKITTLITNNFSFSIFLVMFSSILLVRHLWCRLHPSRLPRSPAGSRGALRSLRADFRSRLSDVCSGLRAGSSAGCDTVGIPASFSREDTWSLASFLLEEEKK